MLDSSSGGSGFKPETVMGHGWVERGSSQVIWSSNTDAIFSSELLMVVN